MNKRAVNIALMPEKSMYNQVLELNSNLASQGSDLILGKEAFPHITLVQGVVSESDISKICSILERAGHDTKKINLIVDEIDTGRMSGLTSLKIKKTENIYELHKKVWEQLKPYLTFDAEKSMFANPSEITKEVDWVKDFPLKSVLEQYNPHITLGFGKLSLDLPMYFVADKLAVYQMGKYCSCSKEIKTFALK